eukprot:TRINITY_DN2819_c0_g1_i1.p1 TRINITY_DN2819_c0_g1~~TRINITY_DN2819_c0_g1_i1.p1  ORF type:complete len:199 (+),score=47.43 TRINITY_DN2819_c0_g1_i1:369-965(+)
MRKLEEMNTPPLYLNWIWSIPAQQAGSSEHGRGERNEPRERRRVPQGTVLSPLLFLYHVDDIARTLEAQGNEILASLYADDMAAIVTGDSHEEAQTKAQAVLEKIDAWAERWGLKLSRRKTCYMTTGSKNKQQSTLYFMESTQKTEVKYEENPMFLGVIFDEKVTFKAHVSYVKRRLNERLKVLSALSGKEWGSMARR